MATGADIQASFAQSIADIGRENWDACAPKGHPFLSYDFLHSLEESGCASAETGWQPYHARITSTDTSEILAVMPLYVKSHSYGEYVFDHAWADAYERAGGRYYPKLQSSIPFTPATGPRLLTRVNGDLQQALLQAGKSLTDRLGLSSLHLTFLPEEEAMQAEQGGYLVRNDQQFHWQNQGYAYFDDFLAALSSRKRKQIRKERRMVADAGITIECLTGKDIQDHHWDHFFACYIDTGARKWGQPYLNRDFFSLVGERMANEILLVHCSLDDRPIASALNFIGGDTLYGRNWGCLEDHPCLHFEACYYQAIDFAIKHGLAFVEAGAQGPHKVARGYEPVTTYSVHYLRDPGFHDAVARYLEAERQQVQAEIEYFSDHTPFRKG
ncbi:MAG: N-acetyltransferase [Alphaproteobacteria bacterium]|nr:N-acetyltransferase [Alphaproteobacteria bacterium]